MDDVRAAAVATGLTWGGGVLALGLLATRGCGVEMVRVLGSVYRGFVPGPRGAVVGAGWALVDGAAAGATLAGLYRWLTRRERAVVTLRPAP